MPKGEKDNEFDSEDFDEGAMVGDGWRGAQLDVELDEAEHGDADAGAFDDDDLWRVLR